MPRRRAGDGCKNVRLLQFLFRKSAQRRAGTRVVAFAESQRELIPDTQGRVIRFGQERFHQSHAFVGERWSAAWVIGRRRSPQEAFAQANTELANCGMRIREPASDVVG